MTFKLSNVSVSQLSDKANIPYELLLLADPNKNMIDAYVERSKIIIASINQNTVGILVLLPLSADIVEIKNISVKDEFQGRGIGKLLLDAAVELAKKEKYKSICIGTANSSIRQLYIYQRKEFEISGILQNFFLDNYPETIIENGIQAKHLIMLTKKLT